MKQAGLTAEIIKKAEAKKKRYTISDGRGLIMEIHPTGKKSWIVRYYRNSKEHRKQIGEYPDINIIEAREINTQIKKQARTGEKITTAPAEKITFKKVAEEWLKVRLKGKSDSHYRKTESRLKHLYNAIGIMEISEIKPRHILEKCRELEDQGRIDTAHRIRSIASQVFQFAIASEQGETDPASMLSKALTPKGQAKHYATITKEAEIVKLMQAINNYNAKSGIVRLALFFSALTFARPGEIRRAEWSEINWSTKEWTIPAEKMKMKHKHVVPLADQTLEILRELSLKTENPDNIGGYIFPSERRDGRPMSENTIRVALRLLGYSNEEMTAHGFRGMASTILNEQGYRADVIERQLAHSDRNAIRSAYNHADYIDERRKMMTDWANYLYSLLNQTRSPYIVDRRTEDEKNKDNKNNGDNKDDDDDYNDDDNEPFAYHPRIPR